MALEKITETELQAGDVRKRWRTIAKLAAAFNALLNFQIVTNSGRNKFTLSESNAVLELDIKATGSTAKLYPWQPYPAPYVGSGDAPDSQAFKLRLRPGLVYDGVRIWRPSNLNVEVPVPPGIADGFFVWLRADVDEDGLITALKYEWGVNLPVAPAPASKTALPTVVYDVLCMVTSTAAGVELGSALIYRSYVLDLLPKTVGTNAAGVTLRRLVFSPVREIEDIPYVPPDAV